MLIPQINHASLLVMQDAIHAELTVSHLYKHLSNQCQRLGLFGAAKFFKNESADEITHYEKIAQYLNDRGSVATLPALEAEEDGITTLEEALMIAYQAEIDLGNRYAEWYSNLCMNDPISAQFLLQFLEIQKNSIGEFGDLIARYELAKGDKAAVLLFDQEMGT